MSFKPRIILVTGTDTEIGKTTVTAVLAASLHQAGAKVRALKPIETGCVGSGAQDSLLLAQILGEDVPDEPGLNYRFPAPVSPFVAARDQGTVIDRHLLLEAIREQATQVDILLVEGTGGVLAPIAENYTYADLARDMDLEALVVVGSRLGALNHALLTFEALCVRKIKVLGYVLNDLFRPEEETEEGTLRATALSMNREILRELATPYEIEEVGYLPYIPDAGNISVLRKLPQSKVFSELQSRLLHRI